VVKLLKKLLKKGIESRPIITGDFSQQPAIKKYRSILKINNTCTTYFEQETNVFSYYFLKLILFIKIDDLNNLLIKYTSHYKINNNEFIIKLYELLKNNVNLIDTLRLKSNVLSSKYYNNSLRLTLYEIK